MSKFIPLLLIVILCGCSSPPISMTEDEIDDYVVSCTSSDVVYDIGLGLRYSREDEAYQVNDYTLNDSIVLYNIEETTQYTATNINIFYKDDWPVYTEEFYWEFPQDGFYKVTERKIYLTGDDVLVAYERSADSDEEVEGMAFTEIDVEFEELDFERPKNAVAQEGDFEMKFGEFLIINPESYLVLDNDDSGYGVALYIMEGDMLLDQLYASPEEFKGKTIQVYHEFMNMSGIIRMIYRGGIVKE
jgi:hypothetical protein